MTGPPHQLAFDSIARPAAGFGLDLAAPLAARWYNEAVAAEHRVPDFGRRDALAVVLGNTRALWPHFLAALRDDDALYAAEDPLEAWLVERLGAVVRQLPWRTEVRHAHEAPPRRVAIQVAAEVAGLAPRAPSLLSVHPVFGPWIALRAVVVVDVAGPLERPPIPPLPCHECDTHCHAAFDAARLGRPHPGHGDVRAEWQRWLAVRDACPAGAEHRYDEAQIRYHYTKDLEALRRLVRGQS